jgi:hypothetical protein
MIELHEIEELFKNVNRGAIKAFLRNAAILKDPNATPAMKELAEANVKAISQNQPIPKVSAKPKKQKVEKEVKESKVPLLPKLAFTTGEIINFENALGNPRADLHFIRSKKGGLRVHIKEVK